MRLVFISLTVTLIVVAGFIGFYLGGNNNTNTLIPSIDLKPEKPLEIYSIDNLSKVDFNPGKFELISDNIFSFEFTPNPELPDTKKTTGVINFPTDEGKYPLVIMFRGYVDQEIYTSGIGTKSASKYFVENGFITIAPDFLGYAGGDSEAKNIFESRFQTYTTAASILQSIEPAKKTFLKQWDGENVFIWGHSNGGQIALTVLEITRSDYPTVLWAPVSKPFPYSILYYTDDSEDRGKLIRRELAKFEELYDVENYSLVNYLDRISAPIQIHQGTLDNAVPKKWSDRLTSVLDKSEIENEYYVYRGADHNLRPSWDEAIASSLAFYESFMQ